MNDEQVRRQHVHVLRVAVTLLLAALAVQPWWMNRNGGDEDVVTGWGTVASLSRWAASSGESVDALSGFIAWYVLLALTALTAGALVPPDAVPRWVAVVLGLVAVCLGGGLAAMDLGAMGNESNSGVVYGAFHASWVTAFGVGVLWFLTRREPTGG